MLKSKQHLGIAAAAFTFLLLLGFSNKVEVKESIHWSERPLVWSDFPILKAISGDYDAKVHSGISYEGTLAAKDLKIVAFMNPNLSGRIEQDTISTETNQLLIHEQYHFNITEYCARLFRKEAVALGKDKLNETLLNTLLVKYDRKILELQKEYDTEANHNLESEKQRFWELKIDGLLRKTAYYADENLFNYQGFVATETNWYRNIEFTFKTEILTSYPESEAHSRFGEVYKVEIKGDSTTIQFFKNGKPQSDPLFEAEKVIYIVTDDRTKEMHLFHSDDSYDRDEGYSIKKYRTSSNGNIELTYYDETRTQVHGDGIFRITRQWNSDKQALYSSYWDKNGANVRKSSGPYHELRELDSLGRTLKIRNFDLDNTPVMDTKFISVYAYELNKQHKIISYKIYDTQENFAFHIDEYHSTYQYDERGNLTAVENFNEKDEKTTNTTGIGRYEYTYDLFDNRTDTRRYNDRKIPVLGTDDFHQQVTTFDSLNRLRFEAQYYPGYVLKYTDDLWGASSYEYVNDTIKKLHNLDAFNTVTNNQQGIGAITMYLDDKQQIVREDYLDSNGFWAKTEDLVTTYRYKYNDKGAILETACFDSLQQPQAYTADVAVTKWEYDDSGNKTKTTYYDKDRELANALQGITHNTYTYDANNYLIRREYYDKYMTAQELDGVYKIEFVPNRFGKDSLVIEYKKNNRLREGVCKTHYTYNEFGNLLSERYYNKWNQPALDYSGVHKIVYTFNKNQIHTGYENYGLQGEKIDDYSGVWKEERKLTAIGFIETISYFNKKNRPILASEGYHKIEYFWNTAEEIIRIATYDTKQNLINNANGIADYVYTTPASSIATKISFYDEDRNLVEDSDGVAEYFYTPSMNGLYYIEKRVNKSGEEIIDETIPSI